MNYALDNAAPEAHDRLAALAEVHDPGTIRQLVARGVAEGWSCLEVGGGLGSITRWLSARVGPLGRVLTTDIDTRFLDELALPNVEVRRHDILSDPLPDSAFDLAYARLVLEHLADPDAALTRMIRAVRPGGWLVVEDFELPSGSDTLDRVCQSGAGMRRVMNAAGVHTELGLWLGHRLHERGLRCVGQEGRLSLNRGPSAAARLARLNLEQLRREILATGLVTASELEADMARLGDGQFVWRSPILWTAWGQRPQ